MTYWTICPKIVAGVMNMPDYQKMYLTLIAATEDAINCLVTAQRACEELYLTTSESEHKYKEGAYPPP